MSFSEWRKVTLGDISNDVAYGYTESASQNPIGPKFLRITDIVGGLNWETVPYCKITDSNLKKYQLEIGDIVIARTGATTGTTEIIRKKEIAVFASYLIRYKINQNLADPFFIGHVLKSSYWKEYVASIIGGSAQPGANAKQFASFEFLLPPMEIQHRISSILSSLDDKIELNRQTNQTLETLAQTLFKEMCLPKSEVLPDGWKVEKLDNLIETVSITHKMKQEEIIFLNTSDILEGNVLNNDYSIVSTLPGQAKKSIKRNDILFSEIRPANKRYAFVNFDADDYVVSTKLMVLRSKGINPYLIYCFLTNNDTLKELQHLAETRSGTFPQITFSQLKEFQIVIPDKETLDKVSKNIQDIYENIFLNNKETQTLIALRYSLLPKLMKGEIVL